MNISIPTLLKHSFRLRVVLPRVLRECTSECESTYIPVYV